MKPKQDKRILFNTTEEFHKEIKTKASIKGLSVKDYVIRAILRQIQEDNRGQ